MRVIRACGAKDVRFCDVSLDILRRAQAAVVALDDKCMSGAECVQILRQANVAGVRAVTYADGASLWSTVEQCRALVLGATVLIDSAASNFDSVLTDELSAVLRERISANAEAAGLRAKLYEIGLVAASSSMLRLGRLALRLSELSDLPVLISGDSGTGKELLARAIHRFDPRRSRGPYVAVNCAAISPGLAESELFGHVQGAFTGAARGRKGLIRAASGGVLFLDEIGEMSVELQAKILRVLQDGIVTSVGEETAVKADVRIIAATNRDLGSMVASGRFRADLFHRLNVIPLRTTPLRERLEDLEPLARHFVSKHRNLGQTPCDIGRDFLDALRLLDLPGNARELENIIRRTLVCKLDNGPLGLRDLPEEVWHELCLRSSARTPDARVNEAATSAVESTVFEILSSHRWSLSQSLRDCEQQMIQAALARANGNQTRAAQLLGITPRSIYNKLRRSSG